MVRVINSNDCSCLVVIVDLVFFNSDLVCLLCDVDKVMFDYLVFSFNVVLNHFTRLVWFVVVDINCCSCCCSLVYPCFRSCNVFVVYNLSNWLVWIEWINFDFFVFIVNYHSYLFRSVKWNLIECSCRCFFLGFSTEIF